MNDAKTIARPGRMLGVYRVETLLGAGGMGLVFRAVDTRLDRPVAIKVCAERFSARFQQEAQAISALNHPHICTLYDVGPDYLVMELLVGVTLATRIAEGPIPIEEALRYGAQIAEALSEAHSANIVHRDLKPGNVMVTRHGVKILDFGIAKRTGSSEHTSASAEGITGTLAYMAPEQIAGEEATPQADLFALGLVLYEMVAGRPPVPGASLGNVLLKGGTPITAPSKVRAGVSPKFDALVARLLHTDPLQRPASASTVATELRSLAAPVRVGRRFLIGGGVVAVILVGVGAWAWLGRQGHEPIRLEVARIESITNLPGAKLYPAYSPDGSSIALSWRGEDGESPGIYVLDADAAVPRRLTQSNADDISPAWSPDGKEIALERVRTTGVNEVIVVPAAGGAERKLRDVRQSKTLTDYTRPILAWTPDGQAIVVPTQDVDSGGRANLFLISLRDAVARELFAGTGGDGDSYPAFSPDGRWFAYALTERGSAQLFVRRIGLGGVPETAPMAVPEAAGVLRAPLRSPVWSPDSSRLVFAAGQRLMQWEVGAVKARELWVSADPFQALTTRWNGNSLSQVVFAKALNRLQVRMLPLDASGRKAEGPSVEFLSGSASIPQLSPDGRWLTFNSPSGLMIATSDGKNQRVLAKMDAGSGTHFSSDSRHVAFHKVDELFAPLYVVDLDADGAAAAVRKVAQTKSFGLVGASWSLDGMYLYTTAINKTPQRVMRARVSDGSIEDLFDGATPVVAADGRRVFYRKGLGTSPLFARSLEGDVSGNPEEQVISECVMPWGMVPTISGVYYVGCDEKMQPTMLRFFEFAPRQSVDLERAPSGTQPILTLSPDGRRLVYHTFVTEHDELTRVTFRPAE
jgi:Tol biopolymer transport system component/predicted Ser/Thr protein kinase